MRWSYELELEEELPEDPDWERDGGRGRDGWWSDIRWNNIYHVENLIEYGHVGSASWLSTFQRATYLNIIVTEMNNSFF